MFISLMQKGVVFTMLFRKQVFRFIKVCGLLVMINLWRSVNEVTMYTYFKVSFRNTLKHSKIKSYNFSNK